MVLHRDYYVGNIDLSELACVWRKSSEKSDISLKINLFSNDKLPTDQELNKRRDNGENTKHEGKPTKVDFLRKFQQ